MAKKAIRSDYETRLRINADDLDEELVDHPELLYHVSMEAVKATSRQDKLKEDLNAFEASLVSEMREEDPKLSVAAAERSVKATDEHQGLRRKYLEAKEEVGVWSALKEAYQQRGWVLKDVTSIHLARIYTSDRASEEETNRHRRGLQKARDRIKKGEKARIR